VLSVQAPDPRWPSSSNPVLTHGLEVGTYRHGVAHLNGILFVDRADPYTFATWTEFVRHHRAPFVENMQQLVGHVGS
jgi:hypothetical protein